MTTFPLSVAASNEACKVHFVQCTQVYVLQFIVYVLIEFNGIGLKDPMCLTDQVLRKLQYTALRLVSYCSTRSHK